MNSTTVKDAPARAADYSIFELPDLASLEKMGG